MKVDQHGLKIIKEHEGLRLKAYPDPATGGDPWTIGYGTTSAAGVGEIKKGLVIDLATAESFLERSLAPYEDAVSKALTRPINQNQFNAAVSFCYNVGPANFRKSSVLRRFNAGDDHGAAEAFKLWNKAAGKVMKGLTKRRQAECDLCKLPVKKEA